MHRLESTDTTASSVFTVGPFAWFSRTMATEVAGAVLSAKTLRTRAIGQTCSTGQDTGASERAAKTNVTAKSTSKTAMKRMRRNALWRRR